MAYDGPDEKTLLSLLTLASRAPSIHNSQPWIWRIAEHSIHLYLDRDRWLPATDPDGRDAVISCGAMLHHVRVALAAAGWSTTVHRFPNPAEVDHLAAVEFTAKSPTEKDIALAGAITRRRTDRRRYSSWQVPSAFLKLLADRAAKQGAILTATTDSRGHYALVSLFAEAARLQEGDPAYADELAVWTGRHFGSTDGVPSANTPSGYGDYSSDPRRTFADGTLAQTESADPDAGELLIIGTSSDDPASQLRAGEATSAVLLGATDLGLASCPLSQPLEVADTRRRLRDQVLDGAQCPQLVVRVGWAAATQEPLPVTPRRPVGSFANTLSAY
ncbi:Acg family FMN-binding oxidoreductase [Fodinicola acaciae]|uniref:Acg family FMN-binding oxidoreductase n=1 Tax=Fodinicola acaciae TaxID=2681555 RepID=UPI0013D2F8FB|nr:NAD(P)H nitroreductase [Fodinicola acaciae]